MSGLFIVMKQTTINSRLKAAYEAIDRERDKVCSGCGRWQGGEIRLSHSHIISRANCKAIGRPELIYDEHNITYHCMDFGHHRGCHRRHEQGDPTLLDHAHNLAFVRAHSEQLYQRLVR